MNFDNTPTSTPRSDVSMHRLSDSQSSVSTVPSTSETPRSLVSVLHNYNSIVAAIDLATTILFCLLKDEIAKHPDAPEFLQLMQTFKLDKPASESRNEMIVLVERCISLKAELSKLKEKVVLKYEKTKKEKRDCIAESRLKESEQLNAEYIESRTPHVMLLEEIQPLYTALRKDYREQSEHKERRLTNVKRNFIRNQHQKFLEIEKNYQNSVNAISLIDDRYLVERTLLDERYREMHKKQTRPLKKITRKILMVSEEVDQHIGEIIEAANDIVKAQ